MGNRRGDGGEEGVRIGVNIWRILFRSCFAWWTAVGDCITVWGGEEGMNIRSRNKMRAWLWGDEMRRDGKVGVVKRMIVIFLFYLQYIPEPGPGEKGPAQ